MPHITGGLLMDGRRVIGNRSLLLHHHRLLPPLQRVESQAVAKVVNQVLTGQEVQVIRNVMFGDLLSG